MTDPTNEIRRHRPFIRVILAAGVLPLLLAGIGAALVWSRRDELPTPVAIHWGADGTADGFASVTSVVALLLGLGALFAAIALVLGLATRSDATLTRIVVATGAGTSAFVTALATWLTARQAGLADAAEADAPPAIIVAALGIGAVVAVVAAALVPRRAGERDAGVPSGAPRIDVEAGERIAWTRSVAAGSVPAGVMVVGVGVTTAAGILSRQWWVLGISALLAGFVLAMFSITVTVDRRGVTVRGRFGWPRLHTPLDEINHADVAAVNPIRHFGGYGYRLAAFGPLRGASGFVLRGGEALVIERVGGRRSVVVVDDAATAAGLLNALLEREQSQ